MKEHKAKTWFSLKRFSGKSFNPDSKVKSADRLMTDIEQGRLNCITNRNINNKSAKNTPTGDSLITLLLKRLGLVFSCALMTLFVGVTSVSAQSATDGASDQEESREEIKLNLQDVDIRVLISTVAEVSGKNFIVDPRVKGKVSVISGKSVSPEELYDYFLAILEVHNFATVGYGNVIKVLPSNVIKQKPTTTLFQPTDQENDEQITQIIQLQHAAVQDLVPIIRPLIPPTSHFGQHSASNSVILTDTAANIQRLLKIIRRIDIPDKRSNTHVVYLEKTKASDMASSLTQLIASTANPKDAAGSSAKLSIQAFDAINALVISATDEQFARVKALVDELDVERDIAGDVNVIPLKYANSEDLVSILNDLTGSSGGQGAVGEFSVQADEASNSLIVKASASQLKTIKAVVDKLDKRRAQVFVETIIAEVSLTQAASLGVTWGAGVPAPTSSTTVDGTTTTTSSPRLNTVGNTPGTGTSATTFSNLATNGFSYSLLDFGRYQLDLVLNAIRSDSNSNVLSTPTILTLDNEEAEIIVGQEEPFLTGQFNNGINQTTTDNNNNTTGTPIGSGFQTIERKDVGIKLTIKPQINEGGTIKMEVFQETSGVIEQTRGGVLGPTTNQRSIEAVVQVDDGQVVALGGLITDDLVDIEDRVPVLGKIPILGALFRSKSKTAIKRNLMVFLKPRIIRTPDQLANYSKVKYDEVRRDGLVSKYANDDFLLPQSEPPVLVEYDEAVDEGVVGSEARVRQLKSGDPRQSVQSRVKDIIFGRKLPKKLKDLDVDDDHDSNWKTGLETNDSLEEANEKANVEKLLQDIDQRQRQTEGQVFDVSGNRGRSGVGE